MPGSLPVTRARTRPRASRADNLISRSQPRRIFYQLPIRIEHQRVSAIEDGHRRKRFQAGRSPIERGAPREQMGSRGGNQIRNR